VAARLVRSRMSPHQEELWVLALSSAKRLVAIEMIFRGTVDSCLVHPRDVIRFLCESNAAAYIIAHNHPSGDAEPSDQDWDFTERLARCGKLMEIPLLDHVVVTMKTHISMASRRPKVFN
jgi:DNA repair protein RadC